MDRHHVAESGSARNAHGPDPKCEVTFLDIFSGKIILIIILELLQYVRQVKDGVLLYNDPFSHLSSRKSNFNC
jgi:hypothetical protein